MSQKKPQKNPRLTRQKRETTGTATPPDRKGKRSATKATPLPAEESLERKTYSEALIAEMSILSLFSYPLLTEDDAAKLLNISPTTLKKWRRINRGPRYYRIGTAVRYGHDDLEDYAKRSAMNPRNPGHEEKSEG